MEIQNVPFVNFTSRNGIQYIDSMNIISVADG